VCKSATGENLTKAAQIADRWKGYCEDLYNDEEGKGIEQEYWEQEPPPLRLEVARAIRQTASRKATGLDDLIRTCGFATSDSHKTGGETVLDRMHRICVAIWETGEWPEEWTFSKFIPLPKKGDLKKCANYRTIALFSHASKILLRIILERIRVKTKTEIADVSRIREMYQEILILANSKSHCACSAEGVMKNSKSVYRANGRGTYGVLFLTA